MTSTVGLGTTRGLVTESAAKEILQDGALNALAAAAGCTLATPRPDVNGIDWTVTLKSISHTQVLEAKVDVQLKCTHTAVPNSYGHFSYSLDNTQWEKLASTKISNPRLLLVMLCPSDVDQWVHTRPNWTLIRHSMYWVNLYGLGPTNPNGLKSQVHVPYSQRLDPLELCRILHVVGDGAKPWVF